MWGITTISEPAFEIVFDRPASPHLPLDFVSPMERWGGFNITRTKPRRVWRERGRDEPASLCFRSWLGALWFAFRLAFYTITPRRKDALASTHWASKRIFLLLFSSSPPLPPPPPGAPVNSNNNPTFNPIARVGGGDVEKRQAGESGPSGRRRPVQKEKRKKHTSPSQ